MPAMFLKKIVEFIRRVPVKKIAFIAGLAATIIVGSPIPGIANALIGLLGGKKGRIRSLAEKGEISDELLGDIYDVLLRHRDVLGEVLIKIKEAIDNHKFRNFLSEQFSELKKEHRDLWDELKRTITEIEKLKETLILCTYGIRTYTLDEFRNYIVDVENVYDRIDDVLVEPMLPLSLEEIMRGLREGGLLIVGDVFSGKTTLSYYLIKKLMEQDPSIRFVGLVEESIGRFDALSHGYILYHEAHRWTGVLDEVVKSRINGVIISIDRHVYEKHRDALDRGFRMVIHIKWDTETIMKLAERYSRILDTRIPREELRRIVEKSRELFLSIDGEPNYNPLFVVSAIKFYGVGIEELPNECYLLWDRLKRNLDELRNNPWIIRILSFLCEPRVFEKGRVPCDVFIGLCDLLTDGKFDMESLYPYVGFRDGYYFLRIKPLKDLLNYVARRGEGPSAPRVRMRVDEYIPRLPRNLIMSYRRGLQEGIISEDIVRSNVEFIVDIWGVDWASREELEFINRVLGKNYGKQMKPSEFQNTLDELCRDLSRILNSSPFQHIATSRILVRRIMSIKTRTNIGQLTKFLLIKSILNWVAQEWGERRINTTTITSILSGLLNGIGARNIREFEQSPDIRIPKESWRSIIIDAVSEYYQVCVEYGVIDDTFGLLQRALELFDIRTIAEHVRMPEEELLSYLPTRVKRALMFQCIRNLLDAVLKGEIIGIRRALGSLETLIATSSDEKTIEKGKQFIKEYLGRISEVLIENIKPPQAPMLGPDPIEELKSIVGSAIREDTLHPKLHVAITDLWPTVRDLKNNIINTLDDLKEKLRGGLGDLLEAVSILYSITDMIRILLRIYPAYLQASEFLYSTEEIELVPREHIDRLQDSFIVEFNRALMSGKDVGDLIGRYREELRRLEETYSIPSGLSHETRKILERIIESRRRGIRRIRVLDASDDAIAELIERFGFRFNPRTREIICD